MTLRRYNTISWIVAAACAAAALLLYILTAEPTASYWDCPEYVTVASRLEIGHPPGNPVWMLTARMFTLLAPSAAEHALAVNIMSGVCSALAVMYTALAASYMARRLLSRRRRISPPKAIAALAGGAAAALTLACSDTFWFSAVEAEVYAFSIFLTALMVWIALLAGEHYGSPRSVRYVILLAYLCGLSIGVHQLNLLALPALALIIIFAGHRNLRPRIIIAALIGSVLIIAGVLFGMMPFTLRIGGWADLFAVNTLHLQPWTGVLAYLAVTLLLTITAALLYTRSLGHDRVAPIAIPIAAAGILLSGIVCFAANIWVGIACTLLITLWLLRRGHKNPVKITAALWSLTALLTGFGAYAIIPIRAAARPPMNQNAPADIFSLTSYLERDQYGAAPLLKGPTPYSPILYREEITTDTAGRITARYPDYWRDYAEPRYALAHGRYHSLGRKAKTRFAPETEMWLPRLHGRTPDDREAYAGWVGLDSATMPTVMASYAVDSLGRSVGRYSTADSARHRTPVPVPTYLQNLQMLGGYQISYMYLRYLMWNFVGRQNDIYAQGESDAGNFITGFAPIDDLMLQESKRGVPADTTHNPGRRAFYFIPLFIGIIGLCWQTSRGRRGRRQAIFTSLLFILTGLAIVIYLNQTPGQPRERDYSFVGSFYTYTLWIGLGITATLLDIARIRRRRHRLAPYTAAAAIIALIIPAWMLIENIPDHNRARRTLTRDAAFNTLDAMEPGAIYFNNGDNYSFPLWYAQEVEHHRQDIRTVNLAYLATPWYTLTLTQPDPAGFGPVALTLPDSMRTIPALARLAYTYTAPADTTPAVQALRTVYAQAAEGRKPLRLPARWVSLPVPGQPDLIIDTHTLAGRSYLTYDRLIMLDILATNAAQGWPRPVYWSAALPADRMAGLKAQHLTQRSDVLRLTPHSARLDHRATHTDITRRWRFGGMDRRIYLDPPGRWQAHSMRRIIIATADSLLAAGRTADALALARLSEQRIPREVLEYAPYVVGDSVRREALDLAGIYRAAGCEADARRLTRVEQSITRANLAYWRRLSPRYRKYTTSATRNRTISADSILLLPH